jgi:signal peptidase I
MAFSDETSCSACENHAGHSSFEERGAAPQLLRRGGITAEFLDAFPAVLGPKFWPRVRWIVGVVILFACVRSSVADWGTVPSGSMIPTLIVGDRVLVNKIAYDLKLPFTTIHLFRWSDPERGDVIVCFEPKTGLRLVKRVIGLPGDVIEMRDNVFFINGKPAQYQPAEFNASNLPDPKDGEHHLLLLETISSFIGHPVMLTPFVPACRSFESATVPPGKYFVMGDNRDQSLDSRYFGFVDRSQIIGKASRVLITLGDYCLPRSGRFFTRID